MTIRETLLKIQAELDVPKIHKNLFGNYNYRNCEDILDKVKPLLKRENLSLVIRDEIVSVGTRYYVKATACVSDDRCCIEGIGFAREEESKKGMDVAQITGAASSYARKYALNGLFLIDDVKDSDSQDNTKTAEATPTHPTPQTEAEGVADVMNGVLHTMSVKEKISKKTGKPFKVASYTFTPDNGMTFETISSFNIKEGIAGDDISFIGVKKNQYGLSADLVNIVKAGETGTGEEIPF